MTILSINKIIKKKVIHFQMFILRKEKLILNHENKFKCKYKIICSIPLKREPQ